MEGGPSMAGREEGLVTRMTTVTPQLRPWTLVVINIIHCISNLQQQCLFHKTVDRKTMETIL